MSKDDEADEIPTISREERRRRIDAMEEIRCKHPGLNDVRAMLTNLIDDTTARIQRNDIKRAEAKKRRVEPVLQHLWHLPVVGPTGATKSTTMGILIEEFNNAPGVPPDHAPVAYICLSETIRSTKALYKEIFRAFGCVKSVQDLEATLSVPNARQFEEAIINVVRPLGTRVVILDEVHNLLAHDAGKIGPQMAKALKSILNSSVFSLVLVGTENVYQFFKTDAELNGRKYDDINLGKLNIKSPADRLYFFKFVRNYETRLVKDGVLDTRFGFTEDARSRAQIYDAAKGVIGVVVRIVQIAIRRAFDAGRGTLSKDDMVEAVEGYRRSNQLEKKSNPYIDGPDDETLKYTRQAERQSEPA